MMARRAGSEAGPGTFGRVADERIDEKALGGPRRGPGRRARDARGALRDAAAHGDRPHARHRGPPAPARAHGRAPRATSPPLPALHPPARNRDHRGRSGMTPPLDLSREAFGGVLLLGNPNAGKTTLFNALCGLRARVGNYPGVTVERRSARLEIGGRRVELLDLPGTYSLSSRSPEEAIAADALFEADASSHAAILVVDATALARNLYLALQVLETAVPAVVALTMVDDAESEGLSVDAATLARALGVEVVPVCVPKQQGLGELRAAVARAVDAGPRAPLRVPSAADADV